MPKHVAWKLTTEEDVWGNTAADGLAGRAAAQGKTVAWPIESDELRVVPLKGPTAREEDRTDRERSSPLTVSKFVPRRKQQEAMRREKLACEADVEEKMYHIQGEEEGWDAIES